MNLKNLSGSQILQFLTLLCLPLYIIRFDLTLGNFTLPSTFLEVLIMITVFWTGIEFYQQGLPWSKLKTSFNLLILFFLLDALVSVFVSPDIKGGLGVLKAYFIEPVLFYLAIYFTASKKGVKHVLWGLFLAGIWVAVLAVIQKLTGQFSFAPQEILLGRVTGVYNSANSLALFLGPLIFLALPFFLKLKKSKWFYLGLILLFSLVIVWTKSRGGLIGEIVSLLIFGFGLASLKYQKLQRIWFVIPVVVAIIVTIFFYQLFEIYDSSLSSVEQNSSDTLQIRFALWLGTANLLKDHPLFGAGLNGFKDLYSNKYKISADQEDLQYPHNILLNFWTETGFAGMIIFLLILIKSLRMILINLKDKDFYFGLGLICAISYLIIHGLVDVPYFKNDLSVEFWVLICLVEIWSLKSINYEAE